MIQIAAVMDVVLTAIMVLFVISALLVILVVLAQEGKGGGLAGAFGGAGSETFGVKAGTVNKFTAWVGALFLGLALIYAGVSSATGAHTRGKTTIDTERFEEGTDTKDADPKDADAPKDDADAPKKEDGEGK